jgi:hypothetical protein
LLQSLYHCHADSASAAAVVDAAAAAAITDVVTVATAAAVAADAADEVNAAADGATATVASATVRARSTRHGVNVADSLFAGPNYCRRLEKYVTRGFAIAVPGYDPELVSTLFSRGTFVHLCNYDMVLQVAPHSTQTALLDNGALPTVASKAERRIQHSTVQRVTLLKNMERLVALDRRDSIRHVISEKRCGTFNCLPVSIGLHGEYLLFWGVRLEGSELSDDEEEGFSDDSDAIGTFYEQTPIAAVQAILETAFRSDLVAEGGYVSACDDGWWHGGVMERLASKMKGCRATAAIVAATENQTIKPSCQVPLLFVYDVIDCSGGFASLHFVCDAQRHPLTRLASPTESFEEVFGMPRNLKFTPGEEQAPFPLDWWSGVY